ncbi:hypothetical protein J6TS1_20790 [Siminovitchia terrae]|uniref:Uncharacterized protein n=1 Tax=Siminovitchia terrae TaxID=1914933 RepID=A0ABQ4KX02_SIMTE|nr:hypothetical protein [Siminovitchia terrae]GIN92656.1 hypothetical protein J22TS1_37070 [Siminovitchia terrae]GIN96209.1 hypothetical protein J6TS1_20790 [Siminovitchia terrae]
MADQERLGEIDQIVDGLLNNRAELSNFINEHLLQAKQVEEQLKEIKQLKDLGSKSH